MTYEEAKQPENIIKYLEKRRMCPCAWCTSDKCVPEPLMDDCKQKDFVINTAIEAVKRLMIPQKAEHEYGIWSICPTCGGTISNAIEEAANGEPSYCYHCGQAIDWSDAE